MRHFFHGFIFTAIMVILLGAAWPLHAVTGDDIAPGMPCTIDKAVTMTANPSGIGGYILTCENNEWVATITAAPPTQPGQVATKSYIDDKIGTLSHEKWCRAEGSKIVCNQNTPSGSLPACTQGQTIVMGASGWECDVPSGGGGESCWSKMNLPASDFYVPYILSADGMKIALLPSDTGPIQISTNGGTSWDARGGSRNWSALASSADGQKLVAVVGSGQIYTSTNSGTSWTARESARDWRSVASSDDGTKLVAVATNEKIYTSTNSGASWTARDSVRTWTDVASSADGEKLVAAVSGGRLYTSTNSGASWTARESNRSWNKVFSSSDGSILYATDGFTKVFKSTNSGVNWTEVSLPPNSADYAELTAVSPDGNKLILMFSHSEPFQTSIFTSNNAGVSWQQKNLTENILIVYPNKNFNEFIGMSVNFLAGQISLYKGSNCLSF